MKKILLLLSILSFTQCHAMKSRVKQKRVKNKYFQPVVTINNFTGTLKEHIKKNEEEEDHLKYTEVWSFNNKTYKFKLENKYHILDKEMLNADYVYDGDLGTIKEDDEYKSIGVFILGTKDRRTIIEFESKMRFKSFYK